MAPVSRTPTDAPPSHASQASAAGRPLGTTSAVLRFLAGSLAAIAVVVVGGYFALRSITIDEAERATRERVVVDGRLVQAAGLDDGVLRGDARSLARLDDVVQGQVLSGSVVRVKLWSRDGTILYSDEPRLIGRRFALGADELELFRSGGAEAELSDLGQPENVFERPEGRLLEAHTVIRTPNGTPVLFEIYERFSSVTSNAERLLRALAPPLLAGLLVLLLFQVPLAWGMARRLRRGHAERERLLAAAIASSAGERRRIAADLHDGVVQDLAGVAFGLAPLAEDARRRGDEQTAAALDDATEHLRQGVRDLRSLLVEIHPPTIAATGLHAAIDDLLSPLRAAGIATELRIDDALADGTRHDELVLRIAREGVRNAGEHAAASRVRVAVERPAAGGVRIVVADDGRGIAPGERERRQADDHVGLRLLEELVVGAGGVLAIAPGSAGGTVLRVELPA